MTALVRSEVARVTSRRLFRFLAASTVVLLVVVGVWVYLVSGEGTFNYADVVLSALRIASAPLFLVIVTVGASAVGAEWTSGGIGTLLTWEPRRGRVLLAKASAVVLVAFLSALAILLLVAIALLPSGIFRGTLDGLQWGSLIGTWLRGGALAVIGAVLGVGLAGLLRNSAGPVGIWLIFQLVVGPLLTLWRPGLFRWLPDGNVQQILGVGFGASAVDIPELLPSPSALRGGLVLSVYAVGVAALSYWSLRVRDVT